MRGRRGTPAARIGTWAWAAVLAALAGCSSPPLTVGRGAPTDNLYTLTIGVSDKAAVRAALGWPRGTGAVRHSAEESELRPVWYYELVQVKNDQVGLKILLVFFSQEQYDGHLWFAANELLRAGEP